MLKVNCSLYGSATILLEKKEQAVVIPAGAVRVGEGSPSHVVEGGVLRHRPVELGLDGGQWVEVVSGLTANEAIVVGLLGRLADGSSVVVR